MTLLQDYQIQDPEVLANLRLIRSANCGAIVREFPPIGSQEGTLYEVSARRNGRPVYGNRSANLLHASKTVAQKVVRDWSAAN